MINRAEQLLELRNAKEARGVKNELAALKSRQLLGADNVITGRSDEVTTSIVLGAGVTGAFGYNFYGTLKVDYQSELMVAYFINNDADPDYAWPYGASINASDLIVTPPYADLAYSDPTGLGNKTYFTLVKNNTGSPITLHIHLALLFNEQILDVG